MCDKMRIFFLFIKLNCSVIPNKIEKAPKKKKMTRRKREAKNRRKGYLCLWIRASCAAVNVIVSTCSRVCDILDHLPLSTA